jgi:hypothetical protein
MNAKRRINATRSAKLFISLTCLACGWARPARAQHSPVLVAPFEVAAQYSYIHASPDNANGGLNLNGASGSFAYNFSDRFSAVADVGAYRFAGLPDGLDSTMYTYVFGPRFSLRKYDRVIPFAQVLVGGIRLNANSGDVNAGKNGFAMAIGGGVDLRLRPRFAIRLIQAEYLLTRLANVSGGSATQNDLRISAGVTFRFKNR